MLEQISNSNEQGKEELAEGWILEVIDLMYHKTMYPPVFVSGILNFLKSQGYKVVKPVPPLIKDNKGQEVKEDEVSDSFKEEWNNWQDAIEIVLGSRPAGDYIDQINKLKSTFTITRKSSGKEGKEG